MFSTISFRQNDKWREHGRSFPACIGSKTISNVPFTFASSIPRSCRIRTESSAIEHSFEILLLLLTLLVSFSLFFRNHDSFQPRTDLPRCYTPSQEFRSRTGMRENEDVATCKPTAYQHHENEVKNLVALARGTGRLSTDRINLPN